MAYRDRLTRSTWLLLALTPLALSFVHCGGTAPTDPDGAGGVVGSGGQSADGGGSGGVVGSGGDEASGGLNGTGGQSSGGQGSGGDGSGGQGSGGDGSAGEGGFGGDEGSDGGATDGDGSGGVSGSGGDGSGGIVGAGGDGSGGDGSGGEGSGGDEGSGGIVGAGGDEGLGGAGLGGTGADGGSGGASAPDCEGDEEYDELADACLVPIACNEGAAPFGGGDGNQGSPYLICSAAHLMAMDDVATGNGKYFVLAQSLDLSSLVSFTPLGNAEFMGTFDGAGRALVGLSIDRPTDSTVGLFRMLDEASRVENLKLLDFTVAGDSWVGVLVGYNLGTVVGVTTSGFVEGVGVVGGLAGGSAGSIEGCKSSVDVDALQPVGQQPGYDVGGLVGLLVQGDVFDSASSGIVSGDNIVGGLIAWAYAGSTIADSVASGPVLGTTNVGGLVGISEAVISGCEASGEVDAASLGSSALGGLVGFTSGEVLDSRATGDVSGSSNVGGLGGSGLSALIDGCEANGDVVGQEAVGGLIGNMQDGTVTASRASGGVQGLVQGLGGGPAGGLVGWFGGLIDQSFASGMVSGGSFIGGLVGRSLENSEIANSYSTGLVVALTSVAGLVGGGVASGGADITNSYAFGSVGVTGAGPSGGLVSTTIGFVVESSYYPNTSPLTGPGTPLSLAAFAQESSFVGWDFTGTWVMSPSLGRPVLQWE